jgi:hypothetical protein
MKYNLWIGNQPNPDERLRVRVSAADERAVDATRGRLGARVTVTDLNTGLRYVIRRASCGLPNCACAVALVKVLP